MIADRLAAVEARVLAACQAAGRARASVRLVAVSKTRPAAEVADAMAAGQVDFGENYAQELRDKADELAGRGLAPRWHFIGALQRNKAKLVVGRAALVHDVDSLALAAEIGRRSATPTAILLGVNIGEEPQKSGVLPIDTLETARQMVALPGVSLRGLMCIPPAEGDAGPWFARLAGLAEEGRRAGLPLDELSMGMSHDFELAIRHGATLVRVGTAIFGERARKAVG